jgi:hypothetical protein
MLSSSNARVGGGSGRACKEQNIEMWTTHQSAFVVSARDELPPAAAAKEVGAIVVATIEVVVEFVKDVAVGRTDTGWMMRGTQSSRVCGRVRSGGSKFGGGWNLVRVVR